MPGRCALECPEILFLTLVARFCMFQGGTLCSVS